MAAKPNPLLTLELGVQRSAWANQTESSGGGSGSGAVAGGVVSGAACGGAASAAGGALTTALSHRIPLSERTNLEPTCLPSKRTRGAIDGPHAFLHAQQQRLYPHPNLRAHQHHHSTSTVFHQQQLQLHQLEYPQQHGHIHVSEHLYHPQGELALTAWSLGASQQALCFPTGNKLLPGGDADGHQSSLLSPQRQPLHLGEVCMRGKPEDSHRDDGGFLDYTPVAGGNIGAVSSPSDMRSQQLAMLARGALDDWDPRLGVGGGSPRNVLAAQAMRPLGGTGGGALPDSYMQHSERDIIEGEGQSPPGKHLSLAVCTGGGAPPPAQPQGRGSRYLASSPVVKTHLSLGLESPGAGHSGARDHHGGGSACPPLQEDMDEMAMPAAKRYAARSLGDAVELAGNSVQENERAMSNAQASAVALGGRGGLVGRGCPEVLHGNQVLRQQRCYPPSSEKMSGGGGGRVESCGFRTEAAAAGGGIGGRGEVDRPHDERGRLVVNSDSGLNLCSSASFQNSSREKMTGQQLYQYQREDAHSVEREGGFTGKGGQVQGGYAQAYTSSTVGGGAAPSCESGRARSPGVCASHVGSAEEDVVGPMRGQSGQSGQSGPSTTGTGASTDGIVRRRRPRRWLTEDQKTHRCNIDGCTKSYGSASSLCAHKRAHHPGWKGRSSVYRRKVLSSREPILLLQDEAVGQSTGQQPAANDCSAPEAALRAVDSEAAKDAAKSEAEDDERLPVVNSGSGMESLKVETIPKEDSAVGRCPSKEDVPETPPLEGREKGDKKVTVLAEYEKAGDIATPLENERRGEDGGENSAQVVAEKSVEKKLDDSNKRKRREVAVMKEDGEEEGGEEEEDEEDELASFLKKRQIQRRLGSDSREDKKDGQTSGGGVTSNVERETCTNQCVDEGVDQDLQRPPGDLGEGSVVARNQEAAADTGCLNEDRMKDGRWESKATIDTGAGRGRMVTRDGLEAVTSTTYEENTITPVPMAAVENLLHVLGQEAHTRLTALEESYLRIQKVKKAEEQVIMACQQLKLVNEGHGTEHQSLTSRELAAAKATMELCTSTSRVIQSQVEQLQLELQQINDLRSRCCLPSGHEVLQTENTGMEKKGREGREGGTEGREEEEATMDSSVHCTLGSSLQLPSSFEPSSRPYLRHMSSSCSIVSAAGAPSCRTIVLSSPGGRQHTGEWHGLQPPAAHMPLVPSHSKQQLPRSSQQMPDQQSPHSEAGS